MTTESQQEIQELLAQGYQSYKNRQFCEANSTYELALNKIKTLDPNVAEKYFNCFTSLHGLTLAHLKSNDQALEAYNTVLTKDPFNVGTIIRRAILETKMGLFEEAWNDFQRGLALEPDNHRIQFQIEELNAKIAELKEGDTRKYSLKQQISQRVQFPEVEEDMLLNFNNLKLIDKRSFCSNKSVSILKEPTATLEVETQFDINVLLVDLVKQIVLSPEEIREIEKQTEVELQPTRLEQQLIGELEKYSPVQVKYDEVQSPIRRGGSILKSSLNLNLVLNPFNRTRSTVSDTEEKRKRVSALQVKNIDGRVIKNGEGNNQEASNNAQNTSQIEFGQIQDIQKLGKKQVPVYKQQNLKRKSSMRKSGSIVNRPKQKSLFQRQKIDLFSANIEGHIIRHESLQQTLPELAASESSDSTHVFFKEEAEHNLPKQNQNDLSVSLTGLGELSLSRKSSILKNSKRKFSQDPQEQSQN